jgi:hypothetical protein
MEFEEMEQERPDFKGVFKRNLANTEMNEMTYSSIKKQMRVIFGLSVSVILIVCSVAYTIAVMYLKPWLLDNTDITDMEVNIVIPLLNFIGA